MFTLKFQKSFPNSEQISEKVYSYHEYESVTRSNGGVSFMIPRHNSETVEVTVSPDFLVNHHYEVVFIENAMGKTIDRFRTNPNPIHLGKAMKGDLERAPDDLSDREVTLKRISGVALDTHGESHIFKFQILLGNEIVPGNELTVAMEIGSSLNDIIGKLESLKAGAIKRIHRDFDLSFDNFYTDELVNFIGEFVR